jgi:hypothetical protein
VRSFLLPRCAVETRPVSNNPAPGDLLPGRRDPRRLDRSACYSAFLKILRRSGVEIAEKPGSDDLRTQMRWSDAAKRFAQTMPSLRFHRLDSSSGRNAALPCTDGNRFGHHDHDTAFDMRFSLRRARTSAGTTMILLMHEGARFDDRHAR